MDSTPPPLPPSLSAPERNWALAAHLSALTGLCIPFGHFLGPLLVWLLKRDEFPFAGREAKEALNAQISYAVYGLLSLPFCLVLIGLIPLALFYVMGIVCAIIGGMAAGEGRSYRYPLAFRLIG